MGGASMNNSLFFEELLCMNERRICNLKKNKIFKFPFNFRPFPMSIHFSEIHFKIMESDLFILGKEHHDWLVRSYQLCQRRCNLRSRTTLEENKRREKIWEQFSFPTHMAVSAVYLLFLVLLLLIHLKAAGNNYDHPGWTAS